MPFDDLEFVRTFDFRYIPRELFEKSREMDSEMIDRVYKYGPIIAKSPLTLLYVLIDEMYKIKGVLWASIDLIDAVIFVKFLSVDKEYQTPDSNILEKVRDFLFSLELGPELKKEIHLCTYTEGVTSDLEKMGAKRSKRTLLEITQ